MRGDRSIGRAMSGSSRSRPAPARPTVSPEDRNLDGKELRRSAVGIRTRLRDRQGPPDRTFPGGLRIGLLLAHRSSAFSGAFGADSSSKVMTKEETVHLARSVAVVVAGGALVAARGRTRATDKPAHEPLPARQGPGGGPPGERPRGRRRRPGDQGRRQVRRLRPGPRAPGPRGRRRQERATCWPRSSRTSTRRSRCPTSRPASRTGELKLQDAEREYATQKALFDQGLLGSDAMPAGPEQARPGRREPPRREDALPDRRGPRHPDLRQRRVAEGARRRRR